MQGDSNAILDIVFHAKQNTTDPAKIDTWLCAFIAGVAKTNGMDPRDMAMEIDRYFQHRARLEAK